METSNFVKFTLDRVNFILDVDKRNKEALLQQDIEEQCKIYDIIC